jgi:beta-lactamase superfamily II metal-dependent hydrolase
MLPRSAVLPRSRVVALLATAVLAIGTFACSSSETAAPEVSAPTITISGVSDGARLESGVTISVTIDSGTFQATLNGAPFFSGGTVAEPGSYRLEVVAQNAGGITTEVVEFEILFSGDSLLIIRMLDLGENGAGGGGDALLVTDSSAAGMRHALIDAGPAGADAADPGFVERRLQQLGIDSLEVLVLTHGHSDHYGGMSPILNGSTVEEFFYNGQIRFLGSYQSVISTARSRADTVIVPNALEDRDLGLGAERTRLTIIPGLPDNLGTSTNDGSDLNDGSIGAVFAKGAFSMFVAGDGEVDANLRWRRDYAALTRDVTILKVGHHGANDAVFDAGFAGSGTTWLDHADAELHLVSANGTSHPRIGALNALLTRPGLTLCTSTHGEIEIRAAASGQWSVSVERNEGVECSEGRDATTQ